jgi:hypothetical protein
MKKKEEYKSILFYVNENRPEIVARWVYNLSCEIKRLYRALEAKEHKITAFANGENMNIITCRMNKNHMAQFENLDGFVVFNFTRKLDARKFGTYEVSIRKLSHTKRIKKGLKPHTKRTAYIS